MLFVAEYKVTWDMLEAAVAKRLDWEQILPEGFRYIGEYLWHQGEPPFRGIAIFEVESMEDVHAYVLHYGPTLKIELHPATDLRTGIESLNKASGG